MPLVIAFSPVAGSRKEGALRLGGRPSDAFWIQADFRAKVGIVPRAWKEDWRAHKRFVSRDEIRATEFLQPGCISCNVAIENHAPGPLSLLDIFHAPTQRNRGVRPPILIRSEIVA